MAVRISTDAAIAACNTITALFDAGEGAAKLRIYGGTRPASVDTPISNQTLLVEFELQKPAFGAAVDANNGGHATAEPVDPVQALQTGNAVFFRVFDGDDKAIMDGDVSDTSGTGDLKLSSTSVIQGIDVTVVSFTVTMPKGA